MSTNSQVKRKLKQQAAEREAVLEKHAAATASRSVYMKSEDARFLRQCDWKRVLHEMVTAPRKSRYKKNVLSARLKKMKSRSKPTPATKKIN